MASFPFPYRKHADAFYPTVPVTISRLGRRLTVDALLDSGANYSLFRPEVADALGLPIDRGERVNFSGISSEIYAFLHRVDLKLFEKAFQCEVGFSRKMQTSFNILGRKDFFELHELLFREKEKKVTITEV